jgi:hypoxanthine phosphoribosyltransferase
MNYKMEKIYIDWIEIEELVKVLVDEIKESNNIPKYITGLPRGGLIPAVLLSHMLDIPFVSLENIKSIHPKSVLIVDDIADSGKTLERYNQYQTAVLHYKPQSIHTPTYYSNEIANEKWIVYPFELDDSDTIQDYLK